ncbi:L-seryl-tRNA(Sec) selenium transferase [Clostridium omnivorum]|uniref:L-seryl-tRNA(Sec) selenium transferase n=1 Tax=Clostridium omnivorum TaxID=1604902 RepID=A0ABQ5NAL0_9CLOT|nr:L-seryl-tRNA(Sec) selenium transferase [Clostridium sp. E14]GLC32224.1 L-seryl-tRNA(Sec) selenium transferase [Clostridium sp. E14]
MEKKELLRALPKVDELLNEEVVKMSLDKAMRIFVIESLRESIDKYRKEILDGKISEFSKQDILQCFDNILKHKNDPNLKSVINATGVIIHTNLGRSLLCKEAALNVLRVAENYNNLEYNLEGGQRGSRYEHVEDLIVKITGAEAAMVVNNNAAAVMLVLSTLCKEKQAVVSRGQLVEIGGSFRIPDVMSFSGAELIEVGTTNRTHLYDYENNINENTGVLLKVHTSNFKIMGFTEEVGIEELVELGCKYKIPVVEDIGSGVLIDFSKYGFTHEPTVQESIRKGIDVVTFSGDKMLGGPQAGIIAGKKEYIDRIKKNQLTRALRIDKMTLAALEGTLKFYLDEKEAVKHLPTLYMILSSKEEHKKRAHKLKNKLQKEINNINFTIDQDFSMVGGGSMPTERIQTYVIKAKCDEITPEQMELKLRKNSTPIIVRVFNGEIIMDLRTIKDSDFEVIVEAFRNITV